MLVVRQGDTFRVISASRSSVSSSASQSAVFGTPPESFVHQVLIQHTTRLRHSGLARNGPQGVEQCCLHCETDNLRLVTCTGTFLWSLKEGI